jgi:hypothetical protein
MHFVMLQNSRYKPDSLVSRTLDGIQTAQHPVILRDALFAHRKSIGGTLPGGSRQGLRGPQPSFLSTLEVPVVNLESFRLESAIPGVSRSG